MVSSNTHTFLFIEKQTMSNLNTRNKVVTKPTLTRTKSRSKKIYRLDVSEENKENKENKENTEEVISDEYFKNYFGCSLWDE
jgi:hypothetical protein